MPDLLNTLKKRLIFGLIFIISSVVVITLVTSVLYLNYDYNINGTLAYYDLNGLNRTSTTNSTILLS